MHTFTALFNRLAQEDSQRKQSELEAHKAQGDWLSGQETKAPALEETEKAVTEFYKNRKFKD